MYGFESDDEDVKYYDKQNIPVENIFDSMEDCFKHLIKTVNYLINWQIEVEDRMAAKELIYV